jgi:predicted MFS family arabinose efflux permease
MPVSKSSDVPPYPRNGRQLRQERISQSSWVALTVCCGISLVVEMGALVAAPMTSVLENALHITTVQALWATLGPLLVVAATTPLVGKLGDMYGHRRILILVLILGLVGNTVTAVSWSFVPLLIGRSIVGLAGSQGLMLAILRDRTPLRTQRRGVGLIAGIQGFGITVSFIIGGVFVAAHTSWRSVFWFLSALSLLALLATILLLPESIQRARVKLDWIGVIGIAVCLCLIDVAISESGTWGWDSAKTLALLIGGLAGTAVWYVHLNRTKADPLIEPKVLRDRRLMPMFFVYACMSFSAFTTWTAITNFAQVPKAVAGYGFGFSLIGAGAMTIPAGLAMGICGVTFGGLVNRRGARVGTMLGQLGLTVIFLFFGQWHSNVWVFLVGGVVFGVCEMFVFAASYSVILSLAPRDGTAIVTSVMVVISNVVGNVGVAVFVALITTKYVPKTFISVESGYTNLFVVTAFVVFVGFLFSLLIPRRIARGAFDETSAETPLPAGEPS